MSDYDQQNQKVGQQYNAGKIIFQGESALAQLAAEEERKRKAAEAAQKRLDDAEREKAAAELARQETERMRALRPPGEIFTNKIGMRFAWCPPGTFIRNTDEFDETKKQRVTLTKGFYLGVTPVTNLQWGMVMGPHWGKFFGKDNPVETVSYNDCSQFCLKLHNSDGYGYRLPTEAEWEYACRAGTTTKYSFGDTLSTEQANVASSVWVGLLMVFPMPSFIGGTTPVASFPPNPWGFYDMHGNVNERCTDLYAEYPKGDVTDPECIFGQNHVYRGGSYKNHAGLCMSSSHEGGPPDYRTRETSKASDIGFRVIICPD